MIKSKKRKISKKTKPVKKVNKYDETLEIEDKFKKIVFIILMFAVSIFIFLSTKDMCGTVGKYIKKLVLFLFGSMGYVFPIIFLCMGLFAIFSEKAISKYKNYSLFFSFIMLISLLHLNINERQIDVPFIDILSKYIDTEKISFTFEKMQFSGGFIGSIIAEGLGRFIGNAGANVIIGAIFIIFLLLFTGLKFYSKIVSILLMILTFIPKIILKKINDKKIDDNIAKENEEIFNDMMNNKIKKIKQNNYEKENIEESNNDINEQIKLNNFELNTNIKDEKMMKDAMEIQKRFFHINQDEMLIHKKQDELYDQLKTESINEIIYKNKDNIKVDDFFYNNELSTDDDNYENKFSQSMADFNNKIEEVVDNNEEIYNDNYQENISLNQNVERDIVQNDILEEKKIDNDIAVVKENKIEESYNNKQEYKIHNPKHLIKKYKFPPLEYLLRNTDRTFFDKDLVKSVSDKLVECLAQFGVGVVVTDVSIGPTVTRYELQPNLGVKVSKVLSLQDDIKLALAASEIRIEAPIPGKSAIGIEVPNKKNVAVLLGDLVCNKEFKEQKSSLAVCIGKDISGKNVYCDIDKMPHLLVAGATGSGKSVCINSIIMSIIYKSAPKDVKLILVDPKVVELQVYNSIPHLLLPVVTDPNKASNALEWAVREMTRRYKLFADKQVKDLNGYNQLIELENKNAIYENSTDEKLARIVIIIDELSDLMMACGKSVENSIVRLAQLSRACGIHLVIATQRPSVNVVTGLIKANVPSRIAFAVSSGVDSRTILDMNGAEDLLGHGDMLYSPSGSPKPVRVQGCFVSEQEIKKVVDYIKDEEIEYDSSIVNKNTNQTGVGGDFDNDRDERFFDAGILCIETKQPSIGLLQRKFSMGFNRAARIIDQLESMGVVSTQDGKKPREVLMTKEEFEEKFGN